MKSMSQCNAYCGALKTCTGFWYYTSGRCCPKATFSRNFTRVIISSGAFYARTCTSLTPMPLADTYSNVMIKACGEVGMKPVCDHPNYCKNDPKSLYIGQSKHLAYPPYRNSPALVPFGFSTVSTFWDGVCSYTGRAGKNGVALCNLPSNTHSWKGVTQYTGTGFVCGVSSSKDTATCTPGLGIGEL